MPNNLIQYAHTYLYTETRDSWKVTQWFLVQASGQKTKFLHKIFWFGIIKINSDFVPCHSFADNIWLTLLAKLQKLLTTIDRVLFLWRSEALETHPALTLDSKFDVRLVMMFKSFVSLFRFTNMTLVLFCGNPRLFSSLLLEIHTNL